jgi:hypothetical protein
MVQITVSSHYLVDLSSVYLLARGTTAKRGHVSGLLFQNLQYGSLTQEQAHTEELHGLSGPPPLW